MARNYQRDYNELPEYAAKHKGEKAVDVIESYAKKRKIVFHRASAAFYDLAYRGTILTEEKEDGYVYIK